MNDVIIFANKAEGSQQELCCEEEKIKRLRKSCENANLTIIKQFGENDYDRILKSCEQSKVNICAYYSTSELSKLCVELGVSGTSFYHECFSESDRYQKIYRYIDLEKFVDLVKKRQLFFARLDKLRKGDKFEGMIGTPAQYNRKLKTITDFLKSKEYEFDIEKYNYHQLIDLHFDFCNRGFYSANYGVINNNEMCTDFLYLYRYKQWEQKYIYENFINCWHINDVESYAMWKIYGNEVCIETTYEGLCNSFDGNNQYHFYYNQDAYHKINIGKVRYINHNDSSIPEDGNNYWGAIHKHKAFEYEKELRCVIWKPREDFELQNGIYIKKPDIKDEHLRVNVNLENLIKAIYVNPYIPKCYYDIIKNICERNGLSADLVKNSDLA